MAPNIILIWLVSNILTKLFIGTDQPRTSPSPVRAQIRRYIPMKSIILKVCVVCRSAITVDEPDCLLVMSLLPAFILLAHSVRKLEKC